MLDWIQMKVGSSVQGCLEYSHQFVKPWLRTDNKRTAGTARIFILKPSPSEFFIPVIDNKVKVFNPLRQADGCKNPGYTCTDADYLQRSYCINTAGRNNILGGYMFSRRHDYLELWASLRHRSYNMLKRLEEDLDETYSTT